MINHPRALPKLDQAETKDVVDRLGNASGVANDNEKGIDTNEFLKTLFGDATEGNVELRSFGNEQGAVKPKILFTCDPEEIEIFLERWDKLGRGMFFGCCPRRKGEPTGVRTSIDECALLWVDIDVLKMGLDEMAVGMALETCPFPPSLVVHSGGGLHAYWLLSEALDVSVVGEVLEEEVVAVLRQLAGVFGGDMSVCELARIMRLPGSHNSKAVLVSDDAPGGRLVSVVGGHGVVYEFSEMVEWLDWQRPLVEVAKSVVAPKKVAKPSDPFLAVAAEYGYVAPLDIAGMLDAMELGGVDDSSIHQTQLLVSASMVSSGSMDDEFVSLVLAATVGASGLAGDRWNWGREEKNLRRMIRDARKKFGIEEGEVQIAPDYSQVEINGDGVDKPAHTSLSGKAGGTENVLSDEGKSSIELVARAVIGVWETEEGKLLLTGGNKYTYAEGAWRLFDGGLVQVFQSYIQQAVTVLKYAPSRSTTGNVTSFIEHEKSLIIRDVEFNKTGYIVCNNGVLDPRTGDFFEHSPDHFALHKLDIDFDENAECPIFLEYLEGAFGDLPDEERAAVIACLQEAFGAMLVRRKHRGFCKGMIIYGPSNTGKTVLSVIIAVLIGGRVCAMDAGDLNNQFGMESHWLGRRDGSPTTR